MNVTVRGKVDVNNITDESLLALSIFVTEAAKKYFGNPENAKKYEEWLANRKPLHSK